ncbi:hypothetical protein [Microbacterium sp. zg.Y909]|uniref:hypothetical protein n=1 Tax=Microbacterium sp. zg.Y909 TaxID=2969413 RepID=UPI00214AEAD8|nr:hypothetical protein [Microbacterium sp. zg.Y909]MCR2827848.1 hypothetical protein [Microbacterium sp. zg.Y909]
MAFTIAEFVRGAVAAWIAYLVLATVAYLALLQGYVVVAAVFYVPVSAAALVLGSFPAYLLGWSLRRSRRIAVHLVAFVVYGAAVGSVATALFLLMRGDLGGGALYYLVNALLSAVSVPLGWYWTARQALRPRAARIDHDAFAEDAAVARGAAADDAR